MNTIQHDNSINWNHARDCITNVGVYVEITGNDAKGSTNKRQHDFMFTVWFIDTKTGRLFESEEAARSYSFECTVPVAIVPPLYK